jgi:hypothetical protein
MDLIDILQRHDHFRLVILLQNFHVDHKKNRFIAEVEPLGPIMGIARYGGWLPNGKTNWYDRPVQDYEGTEGQKAINQ